MPDLLFQNFCEFDPSFSVIFEDDERVAYAYLYRKVEIIADVWSYNTILASPDANFEDPDDMPFLNPNYFISENIEPLEDMEELFVEWNEVDGIIKAMI